MVWDKFVLHLAASGDQLIHCFGEFYRMPQKDRHREPEFKDLIAKIEDQGLRGLKRLQFLLHAEMRMWFSLQACSRSMRSLLSPLRPQQKFFWECHWLGDVQYLSAMVDRLVRSTEGNRLGEWYGDDFERR